MAVASTSHQTFPCLAEKEDPSCSAKLIQAHTCVLGKHLLQAPVYQLKSCGHKICKTCLDELMIPGQKVTCPGSEEECIATIITFQAIFPDKATDRELLKIGTSCGVFSEEGKIIPSNPSECKDSPYRLVTTEMKDGIEIGKPAVDTKLDLNWTHSKPVSSAEKDQQGFKTSMTGHRNICEDRTYNGGHQESGIAELGRPIPNTEGVLIYKITNYRYRKKLAIEGRVTYLHSIPFYSHPNGYKMCARVYLNGVGNGLGSHVSVYFVIMKGEYDVLIPWPFTRMITLGLYDQKKRINHYLHAFRPESTGPSFQRPVQSMNVASGSSMFVRHEVLESDTYLKDDTIFVMILVDIKDFDHFRV